MAKKIINSKLVETLMLTFKGLEIAYKKGKKIKGMDLSRIL